MNPNPENRHHKMQQFITTIVLVLILAAVIGGYIMYGMRAAQTIEPVTEAEVNVTNPDATDPARQEIIKALSQEAPIVNDEKRKEIIDALESQPEPDISPEAQAKRQKTIELLNQ